MPCPRRITLLLKVEYLGRGNGVFVRVVGLLPYAILGDDLDDDALEVDG